jgi:hypothetical protein
MGNEHLPIMFGKYYVFLRKLDRIKNLPFVLGRITWVLYWA